MHWLDLSTEVRDEVVGFISTVKTKLETEASDVGLQFQGEWLDVIIAGSYGRDLASNYSDIDILMIHSIGQPIVLPESDPKLRWNWIKSICYQGQKSLSEGVPYLQFFFMPPAQIKEYFDDAENPQVSNIGYSLTYAKQYYSRSDISY